MAKVYLISFPKSGTHMVKQALEALMPFRGELAMYMRSLGIKNSPIVMEQVIMSAEKDGFYIGHLEHSIRAVRALKNWKVIFLYRDLRDAAVSYAHYASKFQSNLHYTNFAHAETYLERLERTIEGFDDFPDIGTRMAYFMGWLIEPGVYSVRYEDILDNPEQEYGKMAEFLGFDSAKAKDMIARIDPEHCDTFRRGVAGSWKDEFPHALYEKFNRYAGRLNEELGYGRCR